MKLFINLSGLTRGGVVQASLSFVLECKKYTHNTYLIVVVDKFYNEVIELNLPSNFEVKKVKTPKRAFSIKGILNILYLYFYELTFKPDLVFSVFGPTLWRPLNKHFAGFALPFLLYPDNVFFKLYPPNAKFIFMKNIKLILTRFNVDFFYVENIDMRTRLSTAAHIKLDKIFYVPGAYNQVYTEPVFSIDTYLSKREVNEFRFLTISPFFKHKNLIILKDVLKLLVNAGIENLRFFITIDEDSYNLHFKEYKKFVVNLGYVKIEDCPRIYSEIDATFMPTLLESYTAIYAESIKMMKPIITTNLDFAKRVCKDAALYYSPLDANDAYNQIISLTTNPNVYSLLKNACKKDNDSIIKPEERAQRYFQIMNEIVLR
jgi:hypothetical protein